MNNHYLIGFYLIIIFPIKLISSEITDSFLIPGGKLQRVNTIWEESKGQELKYYSEVGRDRDWILLIEPTKKYLYNIPTGGGQAFWTTENEKNKWKPWQIVKLEFLSKDDNLLTLCLTQEESKFLRSITQYRISLNLTAVPLSKSLTTVAKIHLNDLENNPPSIECSNNSWSSKGKWTPCCYTDNLVSKECMYYKAKELTDYKDNAFELVYFEHESNVSIPEKALKRWKLLPETNDMLIGQNDWKNIIWKAMGIAIGKRYAILWLGAEKDTKEIPGICN